MKTHTLEELRALVNFKIEREVYGFSKWSEGIAKGVITQISGDGKTELVVQFLRENPELRVAWIEEEFSVFPMGFLQREVALSRVLFVDGAKDPLWATLQLLRSQVFHVIVMAAKCSDLKILRRFQLAAEKSQGALLWLVQKSQRAWPVHTHLCVDGENVTEAV